MSSGRGRPAVASMAERGANIKASGRTCKKMMARPRPGKEFGRRNRNGNIDGSHEIRSDESKDEAKATEKEKNCDDGERRAWDWVSEAGKVEVVLGWLRKLTGRIRRRKRVGEWEWSKLNLSWCVCVCVLEVGSNKKPADRKRYRSGTNWDAASQTVKQVCWSNKMIDDHPVHANGSHEKMSGLKTKGPASRTGKQVDRSGLAANPLRINRPKTMSRWRRSDCSRIIIGRMLGSSQKAVDNDSNKTANEREKGSANGCRGGRRQTTSRVWQDKKMGSNGRRIKDLLVLQKKEKGRARERATDVAKCGHKMRMSNESREEKRGKMHKRLVNRKWRTKYKRKDEKRKRTSFARVIITNTKNMKTNEKIYIWIDDKERMIKMKNYSFLNEQTMKCGN